MKTSSFVSVLLLAGILVSGCASIVDGGRKSIQVHSDPDGARFTVYDAKGTMVDSETTPAKIKLKRGDGWMVGQEYKVVFEAPGFYSGETIIEHKLDGWYIGNILFGGLIGFLAVDPLTGSMWTLSPRELTYTLVSTNLNLSGEELKKVQVQANNQINKVKPACTNTPSLNHKSKPDMTP